MHFLALSTETTNYIKWNENGITVAGGNGFGDELDQLSSASGICIDNNNETIYIVDTGNDRIVRWKKDATSGEIVAGGNGPGNQNDQLNTPVNVIIDHKNDSLIISDLGNRRIVRWSRQYEGEGETIISNIDGHGLAMDRNGYLYVSDLKNSEVKRWRIGEENGILVAGGNGIGNHLNQFNKPCYIFVDKNESIYVSDANNHRVMKWMKGATEGTVVAGGQESGNNLTQLSYPWGIYVDQFETLYIADSGNHRIIGWLKGAREGIVIVGENSGGSEGNQLMWPIDLAFDRHNNLYVIDLKNASVQKFLIDSSK